ncbi:aminodeoxychorismate synthase component I [Arthrobacter cupressi]|uniref:aminodeoxychorismate synthase n=1 Tax=Arthrobacter cupressi TaxID=1045773 RepID=A0A1G8LQ44_9MICC|nr:aminodeoxychorismate synthase component I [Arthrobacter cupressi]NYD77551.1 anthranilate synthase component 1/para-aminobenzoate synthetase [Arthrobacter cupressi]SDI57831.1 anthranilate synthase component 1/para-aminobenzoate synthetase [Arthrobacter cupressi]
MTPAPVIIAIDGRSGAGKTTLAVELAARLREHHKVSLFHLEDIYPGWNGLAAGIERYVTTVLAPLRNGVAAEWVSWDWDKHYDGATHTTLPAEIVVVEGVGAAAEAARPLLDAVVWVESSAEDRRRRALDRDGSSYEPHWDTWAGQEQEWLDTDDVPAHADIQVLNRADGDAPDNLMQALNYLPALSAVLAPELSARRGLRLLSERIDAEPRPEALFQDLYGTSANAVWLDSSNAGTASGAAAARSRFSILADDGGTYGQSVLHRSGTTRVSAGCATAEVTTPFFRWLDTVWGRRAVRAPEGYDCEFALGWLGYLGYELKRETGGNDIPADTPDSALLFAGRAVVIDHREGSAWLLALDAPDAGDWLARARSAVRAAAGPEKPGPETTDRAAAVGPSPETAAPPSFTSRDSRPDYLRKVKEAQQEITEGNSYEICLTTTVSAADPGLDPWTSYLALRRRNPAPFASYLRFGGLAVASTSPERFLRIASDGAMRAEPIKGTRARANDPVIDEHLRKDLEGSLKDRAENIMIVDLLRNDLSHFAVPGSVTVSRLCAIESYATVHQMVSTIDAQLRAGAPRAEAVAAAFPAGSMTGAPKISTMNILDRLEDGPRGVYSGAIGYFSLNAASDLAVVIRTLVMHDAGDGGRTLSLGVGGAITADSDPDDEYEEIRTKAFGVLSALGTEFPED